MFDTTTHGRPAPGTAGPRPAPGTAPDALLRFALRLDGTLTAGVGLLGAIIAPWLAGLSGLSTATEFALSAFYVGYGAALLGASRLRRVRSAGWVVIAGNTGYAAAAVASVFTWPLTGLGVAMTLGTVVYTAAMIALQYAGLRRARG